MAKKQAELIEDLGIPEIDQAADTVRTLTEERMALQEKEADARTELLRVMHTNGRTTYDYDGYKVEVVEGEEKVKVRKQKSEKNQK